MRGKTGMEELRITSFLGLWRIEREIRENTGQLHHLTGEARFSTGDDGLIYREKGQLVTANGAEFSASRTYLWRDAGAGRVHVRFEDGRDFHDFDLAADTAEDNHWCDPDMYHVSYDFAAWPVWRSVWNVKGPHKDYRMVTIYRR